MRNKLLALAIILFIQLPPAGTDLQLAPASHLLSFTVKVQPGKAAEKHTAAVTKMASLTGYTSVFKSFIQWLITWLKTYTLLGQPQPGTFKLRVVQPSTQFLWTDFTLSNKDTSIHYYLNPYMKTSVYDSIPQGAYKLTLFSEFDDRIEKEVNIKKQTNFELDATGYYVYDQGTNTFFSKIKNGDTLRIFVDEYGCFHSTSAYCKITYRNNRYFIHFKNLQGAIQHQLSEKELEILIKTESIARTGEKSMLFSTTNATYWFSVGRKLVKCRLSGSNYISHLYTGILKQQ